MISLLISISYFLVQYAGFLCRAANKFGIKVKIGNENENDFSNIICETKDFIFLEQKTIIRVGKQLKKKILNILNIIMMSRDLWPPFLTFLRRNMISLLSSLEKI